MLEKESSNNKERDRWDHFWRDMVAEAPVDLNRIETSSLYQYLKQQLPVSRGCLLEAGSGEGVESLLLSRQENLACYLLDFSPQALRRARHVSQQIGVRPVLIRGDLVHLPFGNDSFDLVWNEGVNEHFQGTARQEVFNEMARVCRPGGHVLVLVPVGLLWHVIVGLRKAFHFDCYYEQPFGLGEAQRRLRQAGLAIRNQSCFLTLYTVRNAWEHLSGFLLRRPLRGELGPTFSSSKGQRLTQWLARLADAARIGSLTGCMLAITCVKPDAR